MSVRGAQGGFDRRAFLRLAGSAIGAGALCRALGGRRRTARADAAGHAARLIVFYFPDGVPGVSASGEPSAWNPTGGETDFQLGEVLAPLQARRERCTFVTGLSMGPTDEGSHPGGAKKLLTASDGGGGESIDQLLARTVGQAAPVRHLYLGAQANVSGASGDKHVSYVAPGTTVSPEDDPRAAFARLFQGAAPSGGAGGAAMDQGADRSVLDALLADVRDLEGKLGTAERAKLDLHLEALRDLERRLGGMTGGMPTLPAADCQSPRFAFADGSLEDPARFPEILRAQTDLAVLAMACGLSRVAVLQCSVHTSELVMSRFSGTPLYDPAFDMRSHQASHYGAAHDRAHREYAAFVRQVTWWVGQFAYLLDALAMRPEGAGTMLDESLALLCTEVSDGNTHRHDDMPFVVGGGGGGSIRTGRLLRRPGRRHGELLCALGRAMGASLDRFGQDGSGPLEGLLA